MDSSTPLSSDRKRTRRPIPERVIKIIFALSGNRCAHPNCNQTLIEEASEQSAPAVVGEMCHIYASSDKGPRGNPSMSEGDRSEAENIILLCPTHHAIVDSQHETYPAAVLVQWKSERERSQKAHLSSSVKDIGYKELELAAEALLSSSANGSFSLGAIPPLEKIKKNGLGNEATLLLSLGGAKSVEVAEVLISAEQLIQNFPQRLKAGFVIKYSALKSSGMSGDSLFFALYDWAGGSGLDKGRQAAGLCILAHLFIICDVFER
ncbi:MAG: hypothetical protein HOP09_15370 [Hyphomicrobium sp.]|nr:hypothetical protein [Hyphomicrobium sp.]